MWWRLSLIALTGWIGIAGFIAGQQERLLFPGAFVLANDAQTRAELDSHAERVGAQPVRLVSTDGTQILAWHYAQKSSRHLVIYSHGNGEPITNSTHLAQRLMNQGYDLLAIAHRGFPGSEGYPSEDGFVKDLLAAWSYATTEAGYPSSQIVLHGRSMGGGVVGQVMNQLPAAGVVMESTYDSVLALAQRRYPLLPVSLLLRHRFETAVHAASAALPVFQVHSTDDLVIPIDHGRALARAWPEVTYIEVDGLGHNDSALFSDPTAFQAWQVFLARLRSE